MKRIVTLLLLVCSVIGAKAAVSVSQLADGTVVLTTQNENELSTLTNDQKNLLRSATSLKINGPIGVNDFLQLRDAGMSPKTLDLRGAKLAQSTLNCTYKSESGQTIQRTYSNTSASMPPIITENGVEYKLFVADTPQSDDYRLPTNWQGSLETLYLPEDPNYKIVSCRFCYGFKKLSNVVIPDNVKVIGHGAFGECNALRSVDLNDVEFLCEQAFYHPAIETLSIPGTVVYIGNQAFTDPITVDGVKLGVKTLIFEAAEDDPNHYMIVKQTSFNNQRTISDVYINTTSQYVCENWAFSMEMTYAHGDPVAEYTVLHFPSSVAEHYSNLKHPLTINIAKDPARFHNWLLEHYRLAQQSVNSSGNGWWEFVNTGTIDPGDDPVPGGKVLRTYSDYHYDRIVPRGLKAYIVTGLNDIGDGLYEVNLTQLMVIPKRTGVILYGVANSENQDHQPIISLQPVEIANGYPLRRDYWYKLTGEDATAMKNYLWPTCVTDEASYATEIFNSYTLDAQGNVQQVNGEYQMTAKPRTVLAENTEALTIKPWDNYTKKYDNRDITRYIEPGYDVEVLNGFYRNFYLNYYSATTVADKNPAATDFIGFFRVKTSEMKSGHAYLRLKDDEFENPEGMEVVVNPDKQYPFVYTDIRGNVSTYNMYSYQVEYDIQQGTPQLPSQSGLWTDTFDPTVTWEDPSNWGKRPEGFSLGVKFVGEPIIEGENGQATMIISTNQDKVKDPYYYTLQGVKIAKPATPGIYIHNGKKVVIK